MAAIPGSVEVTGFIAPSDSTDIYPSHDALYGMDGLRSVTDHTVRDNITVERRRYGMQVFTQNDGKRWELASDLTTWVEMGGGINGTLNYVVKFTPDGVHGGNSQIFDNATSVGIGTITPSASAKLHVYKTSGEVARFETAAAGDPKITFYDGGSLLGHIVVKNTDGNKMFFGNAGVEALRISGANVGVGYSDANTRFYVNNSGALTYSLIVDGGGANALCVTYSNDRVGVGTVTPEAKLHIHGDSLVGRFQNATGGGTLQPSWIQSYQVAYWNGSASVSVSMKMKAVALTTGPIYKLSFYDNSDVERMSIRNDGRINMSSLPTSSAGLSAGDLWNNSNAINIV